MSQASLCPPVISCPKKSRTRHCPRCYRFCTSNCFLAEEEGIQPSVALADSRQFSGLVTFATRPLLRRIGAPPRNRTAHTESAARPLATGVAAHLAPRG